MSRFVRVPNAFQCPCGKGSVTWSYEESDDALPQDVNDPGPRGFKSRNPEVAVCASCNGADYTVTSADIGQVTYPARVVKLSHA